MLNIFYGVNGSLRDEKIKQKIKDTAENQTVWILVPEQFSLSAEKSVINDFGIESQTRIKVITFSRLCNLVLSFTGPLRMRYMDGAGKQIIAAKLMKTLEKKLVNLTPNLKRRGFAQTVVSLISEFKRYGVMPENLSDAAQTQENDDFSAKLKDLAVIYESFSKLLDANAADAEDNLSIILPKIKECTFLRGTLFIRHFRSFTPLEISIIEELMKIMDVCIDLCLNDIKRPTSLFKITAHTARCLMEKTENTEITPCTEIDKEDIIAGFANNYFLSRPQKFETDRLQVVEVLNNYREVEATADLIIRLCREEKRKFSDFLILARNPETYNRIMPAVFESRGIDVFLDNRRSILSNPVATLICASLDIQANGYSFERVMTIAKSGLINAENIDIFENYLLAVNPSYAMWAQKEWTYAHEYDIDIINSARNEICKFPEAISISGRKTAGEIVSAIMNALKENEVLEKVKRICDEFSSNDMPYLAKEYKQVWNSIISVFSQISAIMGEDYITYSDFLELFKNSLNGLSVSLTPQTQGSVVFSDIDTFRAEKTPVVIVLGMTEGVFPKAHTAEGILSDAERAELLKSGIQLAPGADTKQYEEQMLIYSVLSSARDKLYLFTPLMTNDGKKSEPSPIIKKIKKIIPDIKVFNPDNSGDALNCGEGKATAFDVLCSYLVSTKGDTEKLSKGGKELYNFFINDEEYREKTEKLVSVISTKDNERISKAMAEELYGKTLMLSASKLEKYNACAFSYFLNYGLIAQEREKAGIEPRSTGTIQHAALCEFFSEIEKSKTPYENITKEDCYNRINEIVKNEAIKSTELLYEASSYYKYVVTRMQGIAARTAWEVVKFYRSSTFRPVGFEITIATGGEIPAITVIDEKGDGIAQIRGIIDRADSAVVDGKTYISIVDYKSSQKKLEARLAEAGVHIQPLLYADIISKRMNASPAAMLYMQMTDPIVEESKLKNMEDSLEKTISQNIHLGGWLVDNESVVSAYSRGGENGEKFLPGGKSDMISEKELRDRIDAANIKIREAAMGIKSGFFPIKPYTDKGFDPCSYCIYDKICEQKIN